MYRYYLLLGKRLSKVLALPSIWILSSNAIYVICQTPVNVYLVMLCWILFLLSGFPVATMPQCTKLHIVRWSEYSSTVDGKLVSYHFSVIYSLWVEKQSRKSNIGQCSAEMRLGFPLRKGGKNYKVHRLERQIIKVKRLISYQLQTPTHPWWTFTQICSSVKSRIYLASAIKYIGTCDLFSSWAN